MSTENTNRQAERDDWERTVSEVYDGDRLAAVSGSLRAMSCGLPQQGTAAAMLEIFSEDLRTLASPCDELADLEEWRNYFFNEDIGQHACNRFDRELAATRLKISALKGRQEGHALLTQTLGGLEQALEAAETSRGAALVDVAEVVDALEDLVDVQNGPPLVSLTEDWTSAMDNARVLIDKLKYRRDEDGDMMEVVE